MKPSKPTDTSTTPPPASQTIEELRSLQALMANAVMRPLTAEEGMQSTWVDGEPMGAVAETFIKPNDRLSSFERLELYNRQYWFRVLDCFYEDYPGLIAVLGDEKFERLARAYLDSTPSTSFTLRNLGRGLLEFLGSRPELLEPHVDLGTDMACLEWAHIEAFDEEGLVKVEVDDLIGADPSVVRLRLQPYVTLLELRYPVDEMLVTIKKSEQQSELREEASNAAAEREVRKSSYSYPSLEPESVDLAVHRYENTVYYKRLRKDELVVLSGLQDGLTLEAALGKGADFVEGSLEDWPEQLRGSFENWTSLGWLVLPDEV